MDVTVNVTLWDPAKPPFPNTIDDAHAHVALLGSGVVELPQPQAGRRVFTVPDNSSIVLVVSLHLPNVSGPVLQVTQQFDVRDGHVKLKALPEYAGPHPLVAATPVAGAGAGVTDIRIFTDFVDLTEVWSSGAPDHWQEYVREHSETPPRPGSTTKLRILGCTRARPLYWVASVAAACETNRPGAIVFFRPTNTGPDDPVKMWRLNRWLLAPHNDNHDIRYPEQTDHFTAQVDDPRVGLERALESPERAVVLLQPWPEPASLPEAKGYQPFFAAATSALPGLVNAAVRFLWACRDLGVGRNDPIRVARLALACFSSGGRGMFPAHAALPDRVQELYIFDAEGIGPSTPATITSWVMGNLGDFRLRLTVAKRELEVTRIMGELRAGFAMFPYDKIMLLPDDPTFWQTNWWWNHAIKENPTAFRDNMAYRHQFVMFGGVLPRLRAASSSDPGDLGLTWLEMFLNGSGY